MIAARAAAALFCAAQAIAPFPAAYAQSSFPDRPIRYVIPFGPGGIADIHARLLADGLTKRLGNPWSSRTRRAALALRRRATR